MITTKLTIDQPSVASLSDELLSNSNVCWIAKKTIPIELNLDPRQLDLGVQDYMIIGSIPGRNGGSSIDPKEDSCLSCCDKIKCDSNKEDFKVRNSELERYFESSHEKYSASSELLSVKESLSLSSSDSEVAVCDQMMHAVGAFDLSKDLLDVQSDRTSLLEHNSEAASNSSLSELNSEIMEIEWHSYSCEDCLKTDYEPRVEAYLNQHSLSPSDRDVLYSAIIDKPELLRSLESNEIKWTGDVTPFDPYLGGHIPIFESIENSGLRFTGYVFFGEQVKEVRVTDFETKECISEPELNRYGIFSSLEDMQEALLLTAGVSISEAKQIMSLRNSLGCCLDEYEFREYQSIILKTLCDRNERSEDKMDLIQKLRFEHTVECVDSIKSILEFKKDTVSAYIEESIANKICMDASLILKDCCDRLNKIKLDISNKFIVKVNDTRCVRIVVLLTD